MHIQIDIIIPEELAGKRLDQALASLLTEHSRSRITQWIKQGDVQINQQVCLPKLRLEGGEHVFIDANVSEPERWVPQDIPLDILFEDDDLLVINKPAGLVVHPAAGNPDQTLVNAVLHHYPPAKDLPRAGIVHRLDKNTTGVMVVAKSLRAHTDIVQQLQKRTMRRQYLAIVQGVLSGGGKVDAPIGRHPRNRLKMAVVNNAKHALTHYRIEQRFEAHTLLRCQLKTGRTHQIRVHMTHINHPIVGDNLYAGRAKLPKKASEELRETLRHCERQQLHAFELTLRHPDTQVEMHWQAPVPEDMQQLIELLKQES